MYRYIWKIKLKDSTSEQKFIQHWHDGSKILQEYDGALGTHIHRVRDEPGSFFLVAEWQSIEARDAMNADAEEGKSERSVRWKKFPPNDSFGEIISFAGEEIGAVFPETKN
jgi:heme-degrading monooxygenase HmoA